MLKPDTAATLRYLLVSLAVVVSDQLSKLLVYTQVEWGERIPLIPFFNLVHVHNPGASFGFLNDAGGWQRWFFIAIAFAVSLMLTRWLHRSALTQRLPSWGCALIIGGAIGNVIDRIWLGKVVDFIDFYVGNWHWPAFNVADSAICVGAALLILDGLVAGRQPAKES